MAGTPLPSKLVNSTAKSFITQGKERFRFVSWNVPGLLEMEGGEKESSDSVGDVMLNSRRVSDIWCGHYYYQRAGTVGPSC